MSTASIVARTRLELGDLKRPFKAAMISDGTSDRFSLPYGNVETTGLSVYTNQQPPTTYTLNTNFTLDQREGVIDFITAVPASGVQIIAEGFYSENFLDAEYTSFVTSAFGRHTHNQNPTVVLENPTSGQVVLPGVQEYLVALLASIEALWAMATDAAQEIDVLAPDGVSIPESQRYRQILELIQVKTAQYNELAAALNVGLGRIQMFTLRRISRTTNRLVPVYVAQEYDDRATPVRVLPPIDKGL